MINDCTPIGVGLWRYLVVGSMWVFILLSVVLFTCCSHSIPGVPRTLTSYNAPADVYGAHLGQCEETAAAPEKQIPAMVQCAYHAVTDFDVGTVHCTYLLARRVDVDSKWLPLMSKCTPPQPREGNVLHFDVQH